MKPYKAKSIKAAERTVRSMRRDRTEELASALATIYENLLAVGLGPVNLGRLARHMLKLRH